MYGPTCVFWANLTPFSLQFAGQLPFSANSRSAAALAMPPETPLDIKMGLTKPEDAAHPLRWGFMTAGRICKDMAQAILIAQVGYYPIVTLGKQVLNMIGNLV